MLCPNGDNILVPKTPSVSGMPLHYLFCPTCRGHWLSSFDANYIHAIDLPVSQGDPLRTQGDPLQLSCPQCRKNLARATGENIPPDVTVFRCPDGHGYFFPAGELRKFKEAQEVKLAYHKQWQVPLPSVASALLMAFFGLVLSAGLVVGVIGGQQRQSMVSQAEEMIVSQKVYPDGNAATIIAITSEPVSLTVVFDGKEYKMMAPDKKSHVIRITGLAPGNHQYLFRFQKEGKLLQSPVYFFSISKK